MGFSGKISAGKKKLEWGLKDVLFNLGLRKHLLKEKSVRILALHGVVPHARKDINARFISTDELENMISLFKQHYNLLSLDEIAKNELKSTLNVAFTFDDGYANNYLHAVPILRKHRIPATFFITTPQVRNANILWPDMLDLYRKSGKKSIEIDNVRYLLKKDKFISKKGIALKNYMTTGDRKHAVSQITDLWCNLPRSYQNETSEYWSLMDEYMIKEIANDPLFSIGSHGISHLSLPNVDLRKANLEMKESKAYLEKITGIEITDLAYPFGHYNLHLLKTALNMGYKRQMLVDFISKEHTSINGVFPRMANNPYMSINTQVEVFANGYY